MNKELLRRFHEGESIPAEEFNHGGLDIHHDLVHPMWRKDLVTKQPDFFGEVWFKRVQPLGFDERTPTKKFEDNHLCRPVELKNGKTRVIPLSAEELIPMMRDFEKRIYE